MTSPQFIAWLERKFAEVGVEKVTPDEETLVLAWRRARRIAQANKAIAELLDKLNQEESEPPANLAEQVQQQLEVGQGASWDKVIMRMAEKEIQGNRV